MMRTLDEYLKLPYTIETKKESDGSYFIKVKELPGCMSVGDSIAEAYSMIEDAKAAWIQSCLDDGYLVPEPEEDDTKAYSGKFMVRITPKLHRELSETAENNNVSLNHLVTEILSQENGIIKNQQKTIDHLLSKVSPLPAMTGEKRGILEVPNISGTWAPMTVNLTPERIPMILGKTQTNRKKGT